MAEDKKIKVVFIETFQGGKFLLRLDKEYSKAMMALFRNLFKQAELGSIAHVSLRLIDESEYNEVPASSDFYEAKEQKGINDGKDANEETNKGSN